MVDIAAIRKLLVTNWPRIVAALTQLKTWVDDHPEAPAWVRERFTDVRSRVVAAQLKRGDAARIRSTLEIVRDVVRELGARGETSGGTSASSWLDRADDIERGIRLAEAQTRPRQKETLARLRTATDVLLADVLEALTRVRSLPPGSS